MLHRTPSPDRATGATFALEDIGWIDWETRSSVSIKDGTYRYAMEASPIVLAHAIGGGPISVASPWNDFAPMRWSLAPDAIKRHHDRVMAGTAIWAAWNAGFDRAIWNYSTIDFPFMEPHHIIDVMAQATANGLAPDLNMAAKQAGSPVRKDAAGKDLIKLFCLPNSIATPQSHPEQWAQFLNYAGDDIAAMRGVFLHTRQLDLADWQEYWAMEAINERGVRIDLRMVEVAADLAQQDKIRSQADLAALTGGRVTTVDQVQRITAWLLDRLPAEGRSILLEREEETDEEGAVKRPAKFALTRRQVERLIAYCESLSYSAMPLEVLHVLKIRLYGGSKMPAKFSRMLSQHVDGVLMGQYVFNGASQTGRASSKGVQIHNLARDSLPDEADLIDALIAGYGYDEFAAIGGDDPVARKLALLIRPTFMAAPDKVFVWSDWSQIEARIVPWLADHRSGARQRLQLFREVDANPALPDLYTRTAAEISQLPIELVTKSIRQRGKVAELALGFCGGVGALQTMGASYGVHISDADAHDIVDRWRAANSWLMEYSKQLWDAMNVAFFERAGHPIEAGRVQFFFHPGYLGGSLFVRLPSGRQLIYRALRYEMLDVLDEDDKVIDRRNFFTFARGHGRIKIWPGLLVENFTQATAADVLRGTLVRLEQDFSDWAPVRLHTHDEIVVETQIDWAIEAANRLREVMQRGFEWSEGLPLVSEETVSYYYSKNEKAHGI